MAKDEGRGEYTVLYDGGCPLCREAVRRLKGWDREGFLLFLPAQDPEVGVRFSWISPQALEGSMHLVGPQGEIWEGAVAVERLVKLLPRWRLGILAL